ncbi:hypothetical protein [Zavarzinia compransoris]|uniref:Uncharacterized protein n=1 Tax=Zavarzinia compransoris TaxID=1264899 RepID=A0A317E0V9_9PROT|nr:hypothetical protein [Zavarzinia compransoris]PWR19003.1 hypothetical protein DKG75_18725 [Zavarzinia compransoris]TDP49004.1 hypothetical protein DES42_101365 [Zavarzinia compransoris]
MREYLLALALALLLPFGAGPARAEPLETVRDHQYCRTGDNRPLRQTVVVVDEALVRHRPSDADDAADIRRHNNGWMSPILKIADAGQSAATNAMLPGELLTVQVARLESRELSLLFSGCSPNISAADLEARRQAQGTFGSLFEGSVDGVQEEARDGFRKRLQGTLNSLAGKGGVKAEAGEKATPALLPGLANGGRFVDLANGIPRILLVSSFADLDPAGLADPAAARRAGLERAASLGIDLQRAEVYVVGLAPALGANAKPYVESLVLGMRGQLTGLGTQGLPALAGNPVAVRTYAGVVDMLDYEAAVQLRLAWDAGGNLVNSWVETSRKRLISTPFAGKVLCDAKGNCTVKGDGRWMGQAWNPDVTESPKDTDFAPQFSWNGFRFIEITASGDIGQVRIFDPQIRVIRSDVSGRETPDFRFEAKLSPGLQF